MLPKRKLMILQTRYIESISYLSNELVKAFPNDLYDITMVYLESCEVTEDSGSSHECIFLGMNKTDYKGLRLKAIKKLGAFLKDRHFDVIIANMYKPINLLMQLRHLVSASLCVGIIHAFGEFDRVGRRLMMRWMIDSRWRMVAVSQPLRDYLINSNCGLNEHNTCAINNAIDVQNVISKAMSREDARNALRLPAQGMMFGTIGRSVKGKRQLELIKAFHQFAITRSNIYLVIIGDGELHSELVGYVAAHNLQDKVYLTGYIPQAVNYLKAFDVFVFPSEAEGFGIALLEAMALSLPAIVNHVEPLQSIVDDVGVVVDSLDMNAMIKGMELFEKMPVSELKQKGAAHCERALAHYDIESYRRAYRKLIENHFISNTLR